MSKTKQLFYDKVLPKLNSKCESMGHDLYVDKLIIDVGKTTEKGFEENFLKALDLNFTTAPVSLENNNNVRIPDDPSDDLSIDALMYFLKKGFWPWNIQRKTETEIFAHVAAMFNDEAKVSLILQNLESEDVLVSERLVNLVLQRVSFQRLLLLGLKQRHPALGLTLAIMFPTSLSKKLKEFYFIFFTNLLVTPPLLTKTNVNIFLNRFLQLSRVDRTLGKEKVQAVLKAINKKTKRTALIGPFLLLKNELEKVVTSSFDLDQTAAITEPASRIQNKQKDTGSATLGIDTGGDDSEKIKIQNSGLILFHPFLSAVFKDLGWLDVDKKFLNQKTQQKAILFSQFLINRKNRQAEHTLVLNKILCGCPINLPVTTACNFSVKEKQAAIELIESLKEYWTVLKNTSDRGLIESFIERPGIIQKTESGFLLQAERKTIDVLMESLPFGINTIKLPWNEYIVYTEW